MYSFDDDLLRFAKLVLLRIDPTGRLAAIHPSGASLAGWSDETRPLFDLHKHVLAPNHLSKESLVGGPGTATPSPLVWIAPDGSQSPPLSTFWRSDNGDTGDLLAVVRPDPLPAETPSPDDKKYYFQARNLPGLIHNIRGALGTLFGRAELLRYKYPEIADVEELIKMGYRVQDILNNFSYKVNHDKRRERTAINLNRFLTEEVTFLNSDLFFKHQVAKEFELDYTIPEFAVAYAALSGVVAECYHAVRPDVNEKAQYTLTVRTFYEEPVLGFEITLSGPLAPQGHPHAAPLRLNGDHRTIDTIRFPRLDTRFLAHCMREHEGRLELTYERDRFSFRYAFPRPRVAALADG